VQLNWNGRPLVTDIRWNALGQPTAWAWAFVTPTLTASRRYDNAGRLTATEFSRYTYDPAGRISALTQQLYGPADANPANSSIAALQASWAVGYDPVGRIARFDGSVVPLNARGTRGEGSSLTSTSFSYDPNGNRTASTRSRTGQSEVSRSYSASANRLTGFTQSAGGATTSVAYTFNANGDLIGDGLRTYSFDAEGRLAAVTAGATDSSPTTRYAHNALGQRVFKTEPLFPPSQGEQSNPGLWQGLTTFFTQLWNPANPAEQLGFAYVYAEDGTLIAEAGSGGAFSSGSTQYIYLPTAGGPMPIAAAINGQMFAVHSDHLNTPRRLTNEQGQAVWQWAYSAFGDEKPTTAHNRFANLDVTPSPGTTNLSDVVYNIGYPGQYRDKESGLSQNWHRYYDSRTGRYTQNDLIGLAGGWNRVPYANLNPLMFVDPTGLDWIYSQGSGQLFHQPSDSFGGGPPTPVGPPGYTGHGLGVNNPALELIPSVGPIPIGSYSIGPQQTNVTGAGLRLPGSMRLTPDPANWMYGRGGFLIHGDNSRQDRSASEGCIIEGPAVRNSIGKSADRVLRVIP
jgi:RHS repeat-associated protein